jgi:amino acid permease
VAADCLTAFGSDRRAAIFAPMALVAPFAFLCSLRPLRKLSALAIVSTLGLLAAVATAAIVAPSASGAAATAAASTGASHTPFALLCTLPLFLAAFTCQQTLFLSLGANRSASTARAATAASRWSPLLLLALYLLLATAPATSLDCRSISALLFGLEAGGPVLAAAARVCLIGVVVSTLPLQLITSRASLLALLNIRGEAASSSDAPVLPLSVLYSRTYRVDDGLDTRVLPMKPIETMPPIDESSRYDTAGGAHPSLGNPSGGLCADRRHCNATMADAAPVQISADFYRVNTDSSCTSDEEHGALFVHGVEMRLTWLLLMLPCTFACVVDDPQRVVRLIAPLAAPIMGMLAPAALLLARLAARVHVPILQDATGRWKGDRC